MIMSRACRYSLGFMRTTAERVESQKLAHRRVKVSYSAPLLIIIFWLITLPLATGADTDLDRVVDAGVLNTGADAALDRVVDAGVLNTGPRAPCSSLIA